MCTSTMDPELLVQNMCPELLALLRVRPSSLQSFVGAFLPRCPKPRLGPETRASVRLKKGYTVIDGIGSHQNGKHLLGPSPGGGDTLEEVSYNSDEEAMLKDVLAEDQTMRTRTR